MPGAEEVGQEPWAPRGGGCVMDHLGAPLWPGVGSVCLLLAGAAWATQPNFPDPNFESKGKDGSVWRPLHWVLGAIPGSEPPSLGPGGQIDG